MNLNTNLPKTLSPYFKAELEAYVLAYNAGDLAKAWVHLERAHIIGQRYPFAHTYVHWKMLQFGFRIKSTKEVLGQIPRLLVGGVKSFVGKVPLGNPGGANVPPMKPFPIDADIKAIFEKARIDVF
jgi:hypothetical protein